MVSGNDPVSAARLYTVNISKGSKELVPGGIVTAMKKSIRLPKNSGLLPAVARAVQDIMDHGTYSHLVAKCELTSLAETNITVNGQPLPK